MEFGARRARGIESSIEASKYGVIGGCVGTSNTFAGMKYQKICPDATYDIWTLRQNTNPTVQIQDNEKAINSRSVIHDSIGTSDYTTVCPLQNNPFFSSIQTAATK